MSDSEKGSSRITPWIPLFQTGMWVLLVSGFIFAFRGPLHALTSVFVERARSGAGFSIGSVSIGAAPPAVAHTLDLASATAEGVNGSEATENVSSLMERKAYPPAIQDSVFLIHEAQTLVHRTTPRSGRYRIRIWLETYDPHQYAAIKRVTYRLYDDFNPRVISTETNSRQFELWLNSYGEFTVVALVETASGKHIWLTRYLNLPGRPPD